MEHISERVNALAPSQTLAMSQKSQELKAQGIDVINLSVGEPDFNTPDHIKQAAVKAIEDNCSFYTPVPGYMSLRKSISEASEYRWQSPLPHCQTAASPALSPTKQTTGSPHYCQSESR